jgi:hypothetical protein
MEFKFLINTITDWSEPPRARHQVTNELSKKHKVIFINANVVGFPKITLKEENENLSILIPRFPFSYKVRYRVPLINEIYQYWLFSLLNRKYNDYIVINFDFSAYKIHNYFCNVVYYCNDNFTKISQRINNYLIYKYHVFCEKELVMKSKFCIATTYLLKQKLESLNPKVYEIQLGGPALEEYGVKPNLVLDKSKRKIVVGLVGFLRNDTISSEVLNALSETGEFHLNLIGPVDSSLSNKLKNHVNLTFFGVLKGKELYESLNVIVVAIAPYHFSSIDLSPNKLLIYLALGKPTVVTSLPAVKSENYGEDLVYFADNVLEFVGAVKLAYSRNSSLLMERRVSFAEKNTWAKRVDIFLNILKINN